MNPLIHNQATFFYRGKWNAAMDTLLLSTVIKLRTGSSSTDDFVTDSVLNEACKLINLRFATKITCADVVSRLELLRVRHQTFNEVVTTPGVRWDLDEKLIVADEETLKFIFRTNPLAGAYYYQDEAEYNRLTTMFGLQDVKKEKSREVITMSDTTELIVITDSPVPNAPTRGKHAPSPVDPDEVNSPFIDQYTMVRRKLFDEPSTNTKQGSPSRAGGLVGRMDPTRLLPVKQLYSSPKGSSCACWSPAAPSRKLTP
ncbi:hypothetical protein SASPL_101256 [Salvia splendens]|uniref:Myb/SANT-like domain-containing protein n=1 Tax=Salvia splendens TaxID=180675 RepID=A0A8X8YRD7_SALSN|nr:uncharacterized protein LOC121804824 [Salvia splendens]KAG6436360.1 hypothetical protein SASPL_101256 [Salvia splendens]